MEEQRLESLVGSILVRAFGEDKLLQKRFSQWLITGDAKFSGMLSESVGKAVLVTLKDDPIALRECWNLIFSGCLEEHDHLGSTPEVEAFKKVLAEEEEENSKVADLGKLELQAQKVLSLMKDQHLVSKTRRELAEETGISYPVICKVVNLLRTKQMIHSAGKLGKSEYLMIGAKKQ